MIPSSLQTKRLLLRPWQKSDFIPFAQLNADPRVMEYFQSTLTRQESDQQANRYAEEIEARGWGLWAASLLLSKEFIGFIGLCPVPFSFHPTPAVEIGWRLAYDFWGQGYAVEGAIACLRYAFETLQLNEIVSFTAVINMRSRRVMEKLGMHHKEEDDFDHPKLPEGHRLRRHVLYRITFQEWKTLWQKDAHL